ncbi:hypothetical protein FACS189434_07870 [Bacteroidia bacterium]|nr:hypothetical protein FACS189434_07870 [Bacteroidia bacterium]
MNTNITIEQLAEKMSEKVWQKGDMKRIYLNDAGWNTKKMSTKTFIFQNENGDFVVSCKIDCPSQSYNWIASQENEVKERIYEMIEGIFAENVYLIKCKETGLYMELTDYADDFKPLEYGTKFFTNRKNAEKYIEDMDYCIQNVGKTFEVEEISKEYYNSETTFEKFQERKNENQKVVEQPENKETFVEITKNAVVCDGITASKKFYPETTPSTDNSLMLWVYQKNVTTKGYSWMPIVEIDEKQNHSHTHKVGDYYCILPTNETHDDYCFESWLKKYCEIIRLLEPTAEMKTIRG